MGTSKKVKAYTLSTCPYCRAFKMFCTEESIPLEYTDVDQLKGDERKKIMDEVDKVCPDCGYPIIIIDGEVIEGFNEDKIRRKLGL
jgi:glutaredoxin-like protein NrdH